MGFGKCRSNNLLLVGFVLLGLSLLVTCVQARPLKGYNPPTSQLGGRVRVNGDVGEYYDKVIALWAAIKNSGPSPGIGHSFVSGGQHR